MLQEKGEGIIKDLKKMKTDLLYLSRRNELLEKILSSIPSFVYVRDINLKFLIVNEAFENFIGKKAKDIIGKTDFDFFPENIARKMAEDDLEVINRDCAKLNIEESISMPDGRHFWLSANIAPYHDKDGKVCGILGISNDITEVKKMSNQVETILDGLPYEAWLKDKEGRYLAVNELLANGVSKSKNEMIGKTDLDVYPEETAKRFRAADLEIMKQKKAKLFEEFAYADNLLKLHETYKAPVINEAGEAIGTTGYSKDISGMQKNLFETEKQIHLFNSIIDNIPIMLFLKDAKELKFKMINKAAEELLGFSRNEMLGKTDYEIFPENQADFFNKKDREVISNKGNLFIRRRKNFF